MPAESGPWTGLPQLQPGAGLAPAGVSGANQDGRVSLCLFDSPINTLQSAHPDVQCPPVPPHPRTPPGPLHPQQAKWGGAPAPRHFLLAQARPGSPWPSFTVAARPGLLFRSRPCAKPLAHRGTQAACQPPGRPRGPPRTPAQRGAAALERALQCREPGGGPGTGPEGPRNQRPGGGGVCSSLHQPGSGPAPWGARPRRSPSCWHGCTAQGTNISRRRPRPHPGTPSPGRQRDAPVPAGHLLRVWALAGKH